MKGDDSDDCPDFGTDETIPLRAVNRDANDDYLQFGAPSIKAALARAMPIVSPDLPRITATPFIWRDPATIPPRPWIYGRQLLRQAVSLIVAPGGTGKSALTAGMAVSLASGREFLRHKIWGGPKRVWLWNLEDGSDEMARSIQAAAMHWSVPRADLESRLFVDSGLDGPGFKLAKLESGGAQIVRPVSDGIARELRAHGVDVLIVDPFVSSHSVPENDNPAIDMVAKEWAAIAHDANCAVLLVHHTSKRNGNASDADSARGASALVNAARFVLALNPMDKAASDMLGIEDADRHRFVRCDAAKSNRAPAGDAMWIELTSVALGNGDATYTDGDSMAVVVPWTPPNAFADVSASDVLRVREAAQSGDWRKAHNCRSGLFAADGIAAVLGIDRTTKGGKAKAATLLRTWLANGVLKVERRKDGNREERDFVVPGDTVPDND